MELHAAGANNAPEEKVIVSSTSYDLKKWLIRINAVILALLLLYNIYSLIQGVNWFNNHKHGDSCYGWDSYRQTKSLEERLAGYSTEERESLLNENCDYRTDYNGALDFAFQSWDATLARIIFLSAGGGVALLSLLMYAWLRSYSITVTDKRITGKTAFGKHVELPVDSISAVATSMLKGIAVATSSGEISFMLIKNRDEIHAAISNLLVERQKRQQARIETPVPSQTVATTSNAEELKKYKELLDMGVITQEEFDAKKKQLLGL